jgi:hypothetical protein
VRRYGQSDYAAIYTRFVDVRCSCKGQNMLFAAVRDALADTNQPCRTIRLVKDPHFQSIITTRCHQHRLQQQRDHVHTHTHTLNLQSSMFSATAPTDTYFTRQKRCRCYRSIVCIFDDGDELLLGQVPHRDLPACRTGGQSRSLIRSEANRCHSTTMRM